MVTLSVKPNISVTKIKNSPRGCSSPRVHLYPIAIPYNLHIDPLMLMYTKPSV
mgnify:CR=1 FL=1